MSQSSRQSNIDERVFKSKIDRSPRQIPSGMMMSPHRVPLSGLNGFVNRAHFDAGQLSSASSVIVACPCRITACSPTPKIVWLLYAPVDLVPLFVCLWSK